MRKLLMAGALIALAAACAKKEEAPAATDAAADGAASEAADTMTADAMGADETASSAEDAMNDDAVARPCPVSDSRNWDAWTTASDGGSTLHIRGQVDLPTPGYEVTLNMGPADRAMPPGLRVNLSAAPPDGIVTQVITPTDVSLDADGAYANYRVVTIGCGDQKLGEISPVGPRAE
ncbi:MAG: hypothetical protein R3C60_14375 [Parvularculaceae bacterium]